MDRIQVLAKFERDDCVLMGRKIWKKFNNQEMWNFPGGNVEPGESPEQAMLREVPEEVCARPGRWEYVRAVTFHWREEGDRHIVHLYNILEWDGEPQRPAEAKPEFLEVAWIPKRSLPYHMMFAADRHFVPYWLGAQEFPHEFWYNNKRDAQLISQRPKSS